MLPEGPLANLMLLAGMALMAAILMRRIYRRARRKGKQPAETIAPLRKSSAPLIDAPPELTRWQVEMHEVARELRAELDTKAVMVQTLIGMLREEIDRLETTLAQSESKIEPLDPELLAEIKQLSAEISAGSNAAQAKTKETIARIDEATDNGSQANNEHIHSLAAQGMLAAEIADLLAMKPADVEFILTKTRS